MDWNIDKSQQGKNVQSSRLFRWVNFSFLSENVSNYHRLWQISPTFPFLKVFMRFFQIFDRLCGLEGWKRSTRKKKCCPVGFSVALISVFEVNMSQITTEFDNKHQIFQFSKTLCIFFKLLTVFMDWNADKSQQGKNVLSSRLFRWVNFIFSSENVSNYHRLWQNSPTFPSLKVFMHFFQIFDRLCGLEVWKRSTRKKSVVQ